MDETTQIDSSSPQEGACYIVISLLEMYQPK